MQTIILAGGWGTRLGKNFEDIPKPMVKIGDKPILWHIMKTYSYYGYNDFIICLGVKGDFIKDYFFHYNLYNSDDVTIYTHYDHSIPEQIENWKVKLCNTGIDTPKGGRIKKIEKYLDDINMITYGDSLCDVDINKLIEFHKANGKMVTLTAVHPPARFGEIVDNKFSEKPQTSSGYINGGYMVFNKELLNFLDENSEFESDILEKLSKRDELMIYQHEGKWECMDHERDVTHLNKLWNEDKAFWKSW